MIISLPPQMRRDGIDLFMSRMFTGRGDLSDTPIAIDFTRLRFIEPAGVASLANAVEYALLRTCEVTFTGTNPVSAAIAYLDDSGFFNPSFLLAERVNP